MKKVVRFLIKAITCCWLGLSVPLLLYVGAMIGAGDMTKLAACGVFLIYGAVLIVLAALIEWGNKQ